MKSQVDSGMVAHALEGVTHVIDEGVHRFAFQSCCCEHSVFCMLRLAAHRPRRNRLHLAHAATAEIDILLDWETGDFDHTRA